MPIPLGYEDAMFNKMAPLTKRQMPLYSNVGRGLRGDPARIEFDDASNPPNIVGYHIDILSGDPVVDFHMPVLDLVPRLNYAVYEGVREIDGVNMLGYYVRYWCDVTIEGDTYTFWCFDTPFVPTEVYNDDAVPDDYIVDRNASGSVPNPISRDDYIDDVNPVVIIKNVTLSPGPNVIMWKSTMFSNVDEMSLVSIGRKLYGVDSKITYVTGTNFNETLSVENSTQSGDPCVKFTLSVVNDTQNTYDYAYRFTFLPVNIII